MFPSVAWRRAWRACGAAAILCCGTAASAPAVAQPGAPEVLELVEKVFEARTYVADDGAKLPYRLAQPLATEPDQKYPLVLFLHGAGERGDDNLRQGVHGLPEMARDEFRRRYPCYVVAPQCPSESMWAKVAWASERHTMSEEPAAPMQHTLAVIAQLREEFPIDPQRIYATGLSMGGYGVWELAAREPELLAAAAPICGGGDEAQAERIAQLPLWAFHGGADPVVKPIRSQRMIAALRAAGGQPIYTEYDGVGHDSWTATYANQLLWDWMFAQRRGQ